MQNGAVGVGATRSEGLQIPLRLRSEPRPRPQSRRHRYWAAALEFGIETHIIEFTSRKHLANRPTAAARETRMRSGGLHPITDPKRLCHLLSPSPPSAARVRVPRMVVPSVYAERRHASCRDMVIVVSENLLTKETPLDHSRGVVARGVAYAHLRAGFFRLFPFATPTDEWHIQQVGDEPVDELEV